MEEIAKTAISQALIDFKDTRGNHLAMNIKDMKALTLAVFNALLQAGSLAASDGDYRKS